MANEELTKRVYVREIKEKFNLRQLSGNDESLNRWVIVPDVNRPGLELAGYSQENDLKRVTVFGNKEIKYLSRITDINYLRDRYNVLTDAYTPCIILSSNLECPKELLEIAQSKNFPIFVSDFKTYRLVVQLIVFLDEKLAPSDTKHGVMMNVYGLGVLLTGESGIGKSELALELIRRGHMLVADDRVDIYRMHNDLICEAPSLLHNMLELRGVGVIDVTLLYGATSVLEKCQLDMVIKLEPYTPINNPDRLGIKGYDTIDILGLEKPYMKIPVREGRAMGVIIESAVANFRLQSAGVDAARIFTGRVFNYIQEENANRKD